MGTVSSDIHKMKAEALLKAGYRVLADTDIIDKGDMYEFMSPLHFVPVPDESEYTGITVKEFRQKYYNITRAQHAWKLRVLSK